MRAIDADAFVRKIRKQQCEDCVRRKGIKNGKMQYLYEIGGVPCRACEIEDMLNEVEDALTIQPEPHWIPVTEEPKKEENSYWVCLEDGGQCQCRWTNDVYGIGANAWSKWGWKKVDLPQFSKVVAYMPLPEPYKGVTE